jgi:hypothetical protein
MDFVSAGGLALVASFDWSPYFQGVTVNGLLEMSMIGAAALSPIIIMKMGVPVFAELMRGLNIALRGR